MVEREIKREFIEKYSVFDYPSKKWFVQRFYKVMTLEENKAKTEWFIQQFYSDVEEKEKTK